MFQSDLKDKKMNETKSCNEEINLKHQKTSL